MKSSTLFKSIATAIFLLAIGTGAFAQVISNLPALKTLPADSTSAPDTVSIGAQMTYIVVPDPVIASSPLYNPSGFKWEISGTGASLNTGALTSVSIGGAGTYYSDTSVVATFGNTGNVTISTVERSSPKFSATSGCDGNPRNLSINVISLPTAPTIADADTAQGGCNAAAPYTIRFNFSSSTTKFPIYVSYTVRAYSITGAAIGSAQTYYYKINSGSEYLSIPQSQLDDASGSTNANGRYTVTLGTMWDRISANATNRNDLGVDVSALDASIIVLPTPNTGVIKHIRTL